ncbi:MAG: TolC family protein, partial [Planctomycetota bacterium]
MRPNQPAQPSSHGGDALGSNCGAWIVVAVLVAFISTGCRGFRQTTWPSFFTQTRIPDADVASRVSGQAPRFSGNAVLADQAPHPGDVPSPSMGPLPLEAPGPTADDLRPDTVGLVSHLDSVRLNEAANDTELLTRRLEKALSRKFATTPSDATTTVRDHDSTSLPRADDSLLSPPSTVARDGAAPPPPWSAESEDDLLSIETLPEESLLPTEPIDRLLPPTSRNATPRSDGNGDASRERMGTHRQHIDTNDVPIIDGSNATPPMPAHESRRTTEIRSQAFLPQNSTQLTPNYRDLTEEQMLVEALSHAPLLRSLGMRVLSNPESTSTIYDRAIEATDPFFGPAAALAEFDSQLSASVNVENNDRVFNNTTLGGEVQNLVQDTAETRGGWQKRAWNGAVFDIQSIHRYDSNNRSANRFPSAWESLFEAGVRQPLLRGAGRQFNSIAGPAARPGFNFSNGIVIARLNTKISDADFEIAVRSFVQELFATYWELHREYQSLHRLVEARDLAYETWQSTLAKKIANLQGGEADKEAQARSRYYELKRNVANALDGGRGQGGMYVTERQLRQLMGLPISDGSVLRPVDPPAEAPYLFDYDELVAKAIAHRPEIRRQTIRVEQQQYRLIAAKNFLLPQLDLIGRYRVRGFGDDFFGSGSTFASSTDDLFSFDHQEWQFGIEMGVTAGRRQAHAAVSNAKLELHRQRAILSEQQRALGYEIGDAFAEVSSAFESLQASELIVQAAEDRLRSSMSLYEANRYQIEFLLDAQQRLVQVKQQAAADESRYSIALINLHTAS